MIPKTYKTEYNVKFSNIQAQTLYKLEGGAVKLVKHHEAAVTNLEVNGFPLNSTEASEVDAVMYNDQTCSVNNVMLCQSVSMEQIAMTNICDQTQAKPQQILTSLMRRFAFDGDTLQEFQLAVIFRKV